MSRLLFVLDYPLDLGLNKTPIRVADLNAEVKKYNLPADCPQTPYPTLLPMRLLALCYGQRRAPGLR